MKPTNPPPRTASAGHMVHGHDHDDLHNEDVAHEHSDIDIRTVMMFTLGLVAVTGAVWGLMVLLFVGLDRYEASKDPQLSPLAVQAGQLPPEPRLLTNEPGQLQKMRAEEAKGLQSIEDAKKSLLTSGVPARADAPADPRLGTRAAAYGESSSGRVLGARVAPGAAPQPAAQPPAAAAPAHKGH
jgi:hypothetical protein